MKAFARAFGLMAEPFRFLQLWLLGALGGLLLSRLIGEELPDPMDMDMGYMTGRLLPALAVAAFFNGVGLIFALPVVRGQKAMPLGEALVSAIARYPMALGAMALAGAGFVAASVVLALFMTVMLGGAGTVLAGFATVAVTLIVFVPLMLHMAFVTALPFDGREGPLGAVLASWRMVRGRALELFAFALLLVVISYLVSQFTAGLMAGFSSATGPSGPAMALAGALIMPFVYLVKAGIYLEFLEAAPATAAPEKAEPPDPEEGIAVVPPTPIPSLPPPPDERQGEEPGQEPGKGGRFVGPPDDFVGLEANFEDYMRRRRRQQAEGKEGPDEAADQEAGEGER
ncbi:hypothetical protein IIA16_05980 [bacterium]|nr:hypothetical protein [bacterium]